MEAKIYIRSWHGVDLTALPAAANVRDEPAGAELYAEFYAELNAGRGQIASQWIEDKRHLGSIIEGIFEDFKQQRGREPEVLAVGAGRAYAEGVWLDHGRAVTLNEWQEESLAFAKGKWPSVPTIVGDARNLGTSSSFDIITLLTMDYTMKLDEFSRVLSGCRRCLRDGGMIVVYCASVLSFRQMLAEFVKRFTGTYRRIPHVFWGYWRTPGELRAAAARAGLVESAAFGVDKGVLKRRYGLFGWLPPLHDPSLVQLLVPR